MAAVAGKMLVALLLDMTIDELVSYQDHKWDRSPRRRRAAEAFNAMTNDRKARA
jgi:hypothetical protein